MTRQRPNTEKCRYILSVEVSNYDYLCFRAMRQGVSIASLVNKLIERARLSDITNGKSTNERVIVNSDARTGSNPARHASV